MICLLLRSESKGMYHWIMRQSLYIVFQLFIYARIVIYSAGVMCALLHEVMLYSISRLYILSVSRSVYIYIFYINLCECFM